MRYPSVFFTKTALETRVSKAVLVKNTEGY
jgi:hypothetical protein